VDWKLWLGRILPESSCFPTSSDQRKVQAAISSFSVAVFQFQPFSSSLSLLAFSHLRFSLKLLSALLETTNLFSF
jgi:hypothetical protein